MNREPTAILGALSEVVRAVIPMLIIFGFIHWTGEQVAQVMIVVGVIVGFLNVLLARAQVVPAETANAQIKTALKMPETATVDQVVKKTEAESK